MKKYFGNVAIAFDYKSDKQLKNAYALFYVLRHFPGLSMLLARLGEYALKWRLPFARVLIKKTFFEHFCGGETLQVCKPVISKLSAYQVKTALDIGVEGKDTSEEHLKMVNEIIESIKQVADDEDVPVISVKLTAIASSKLLEKYSHRLELSVEESFQMDSLKARLEQICVAAKRANKSVYLDAEESWIQPAIDSLALEMMTRFNKKKPVIFNTYQLYLKDTYDKLIRHHDLCRQEGGLLAAKLVRGAYLEKENSRARYLGVETPVQPSKIMTDCAYNNAMMYCLRHSESIVFSLATHNEESNQKMIEAVEGSGVPKSHIHFCQLYGMSDHITFNLAKSGYTVLKYVPFGKVEDTYPYMIRRAEENSSITGSAHQELARVKKELKRRKSLKKR